MPGISLAQSILLAPTGTVKTTLAADAVVVVSALPAHDGYVSIYAKVEANYYFGDDAGIGANGAAVKNVIHANERLDVKVNGATHIAIQSYASVAGDVFVTGLSSAPTIY